MSSQQSEELKLLIEIVIGSLARDKMNVMIATKPNPTMTAIARIFCDPNEEEATRKLAQEILQENIKSWGPRLPPREKLNNGEPDFETKQNIYYMISAGLTGDTVDFMGDRNLLMNDIFKAIT